MPVHENTKPAGKDDADHQDVQWWAEQSAMQAQDKGCPIREYFRRDCGIRLKRSK